MSMYPVYRANHSEWATDGRTLNTHTVLVMPIFASQLARIPVTYIYYQGGVTTKDSKDL